MRDLAAQVTSSLLRFPDVTVNALLGEDDIALDSVLHGKFTLGRSNLAWLACGPHLEVVHAVTGERFSAYRFSGTGEHPPSVLAVRDFSWLKRTGLLVGIEETEGSLLCLYDLSISRVVKAVVIPGRITCIEPLVGYGGANAGTQHLHQGLRWFFGVAAVVTDVGHVLLVDLCLDDLSCSQSELEASDLEVVSKSPADVARLRENVTRQGRHLCLQLGSPTGTGATALHYVARANQLAVGFSDGYLQLWNMKTLKKEYYSQLEGGRVPVYAFTFQEPENDPRNCCYLWAVQSAQDHEGDVVSLHLLQLAFGERKCMPSGKILYEGLEYCEERYSQDLNGAAFPLRAQATNTRLLGCQTIEKFRHHPDRDDAVNEVVSPDISVSMFTWQVKAYGQGKPSTYIGVFDINRWYHAQMPDSLRAGESLHSCPYLAVWSLDAVTEMTSPCSLLDVMVHERSLSRGLPYTCPPPEQFFNPTTYNFDVSCLLNVGVVHLTCSGYQKETLSFLKHSAPSLRESIPDSYSRCLMSGLLSSRLADTQPSSLSQEEQLDAILCTAVETSSLGLITGYVRKWMVEDQPQAAANLRCVLEWAWGKVVLTKEELDTICAPLFDGSSNFTDPHTIRLLQHSQRLLGNLSTVFQCLLSEAQDLTQTGLVSLINKKVVSSLIAQYSQVVLWFCRTGLLPEGTDDGVLQISRPFYNYSVIKNYYTGRREELRRLSKGKWWSDCLMIDGLVAQLGDRLACLWKRDEGGSGEYPPPTLHALLDIYLLDNVEESAKHAIVLYLLLDVMYSYPSKSGASVESFPTAFAIPISLVKLVQGLWLLDHHDHENSLELLLHPSTSRSLWSWQHERVLQALMCQGQPGNALRYMHTMRPHMTSTSQLKLCLTILIHNRCMVEAWALLRQHCTKTNAEEMLRFLYETCQGLGLMKELLKLPLEFSEQEMLEKFLQGSGEPQNKELLIVHYLQQANYVPALQVNQALKMNLVNDRDPKMKERTNIRNSILDQYGKILPRVQRRLATERAKPYHHPSTTFREVSRPQPLSTVARRPAAENVLTRAAFISNVLSKIGEVWLGKDSTPECSPLKSPKIPELPLPASHHPVADLPEAFIGTPIASTSKSKLRVLDLVVRPSSQTATEGPTVPKTPPRLLASGASFSPPTGKSTHLRGIAKAPELSLLHTPQVVRRARAVAASGSVFSGFTPQSILRSSLRPTPVASPSASPGRSASPPPRPKENRITFIEEAPSPDLVKDTVVWDSTPAGETDPGLLSRSSLGLEEWVVPSQGEEEEEEIFVSPAKEFPGRERLDSEKEEECESYPPESDVMEVLPPSVPGTVSLECETSQVAVQSVDTSLEYHDTPVSMAFMEGQDVGASCEDAPTASVELNLGTVKERDMEKRPETLPVLQLAEAPDSEQETLLGHSPKWEAAEEPSLADEVADNEMVENKEVEPVEPMEDTDLDEFVERHLFEDLSPPLTRTSIRDASQTWATFSNKSDSLDEEEEDERNTNAVVTTEASVSSATSSDTSTDSHSVVSLNESEDSSSTSEDDLDAPAVEDSGSEVEIIEEVKGNGRHRGLPGAGIFLGTQAHHPEFFEPHATVVLSPVEPEMHLTVNSVAETEEAVLMLNMNTEEEGEPVFTELKPSTTLLIPLEQDDDNQADVTLELNEASHVEPLGNFTLMLEPEDGDSRLAKLDVDSDFVIMEPALPVGVHEKHSEDRLREIVEHGAGVACTDGEAQVAHGDVAPPAGLPDVSTVHVQQLAETVVEEGLTDRSEGENLTAHQNVVASKEPPLVPAEPGDFCTTQAVLEAEADVESCKIDMEQPDVNGVPTHAEQAAAGAAEQKVAELEIAPIVMENQGDVPEAKEAVGISDTQTQTMEGMPTADSTQNLNEEVAATLRRATRLKKVVSFPSPIDEVADDILSGEEKVLEQVDSQVPSTPRRSTRTVKYGQDSQVPFTPRRSTRRVVETLQLQEGRTAVSMTSVPNPENTEPQTPQKATPRKGTRRARSTNVGVSMETDMAEEERTVLPVTRARSARKSKPVGVEEPMLTFADLEVSSFKPANAPSSPSHVTRKSSRRVTLALQVSHLDTQEECVGFPQDAVTPRRSTKKSKEVSVEKVEKVLAITEEPLPLLNSSRRSTRSQLWNHLTALEVNKERPLLETTLEVESGTQLADAVMERLKDAKEVWKEGPSVVVRSRGRSKKGASHQLPPVTPKKTGAPNRNEEVQNDIQGVAAEEVEADKSKVPKTGKRTKARKISVTDTSPVKDTVILSPPQTRRKTKGVKPDSPEQKEQPELQLVSSLPATRSRRLANLADPSEEMEVMEDVVPKAEKKESKVTKSGRRRAVKEKAAATAPPPVEINLLSPMPSPAEPVPSRSKRREETEHAAPRMSLRRKRLLDSIFPKPVTRRKVL